MATSYDYDAPIDEYGMFPNSKVVYLLMLISCLRKCLFFVPAGLPHDPKWGHLRDLHKAIKQCEPALVSVDPTVISLGKNQEVKKNSD